MGETVLVVNAGSSSVKFELFAVSSNGLDRALKGQIEGIGVRPRLLATNAPGDVVVDQTFSQSDVTDLPAAIEVLRFWLRDHLAGDLPFAVGHRVVHGGSRFDRPVIIDDDVIAELERYGPLAPQHQPNNLIPIRVIQQNQPQMVQVACFDTAFHRSHGALADRFAIPEALYAEGVRRYGFHGLSYEYIAGIMPEVAPAIADGRVVAAHLGSGASLCAIYKGRSVDSTMGFTALDGLVMGTRPGQLDPGVVLYLITEKGMSAADVEHLLYHDCGLKGVSGISNDMRELLASNEPRAQLAINVFAYRAAKEVAALATVLGGLDAIVFTAGVGENSPEVRDNICNRLGWLGVEIDESANAENAGMISRPGSTAAVLVIPTDEELMIARHTLDLVGSGASL